MKHIIIGTAGHVDHGKTALIKALTGTDTDRLKEEKARGISIDLGFASLKLSEDMLAGVVDVPGHERFLKNMLAGTGGIDMVMLVIAADEGVMPQTREHLAMLGLYGVKNGVVALNKADKVEPEWLDLVEEDVRGLLAGTFLANAPLCRVSAITGAGLEELRSTLLQVAQQVPARDSTAPFRLWIDRVFTVKGHGAVVTGSALSGSIAIGDTLKVMPRNTLVRVRGLEWHGNKVDRIFAGQRSAINLTGAETETVERGMALSAPARGELSSAWDLVVDWLEDVPAGTRVRLHLGTGEFLGRIHYYKDQPAKYCRLILEEELGAGLGDRGIIRLYSPQNLLGGGSLIAPAKRSRRLDDIRRQLADDIINRDNSKVLTGLINDGGQPETLEGLKERSGYLPDAVIEETLAQLVGTKNLVLIGGFYLTEDMLGRLEATLADELARYHKEQPDRPGLPKEILRQRLDLKDRPYEVLLDLWQKTQHITITGADVALLDFASRHGDWRQSLVAKAEVAFADSGLGGVDPADIAAKLDLSAEKGRAAQDALVKEGVLVRVGDLLLTRTTIKQVLRRLAEHFAANPTVNVGELRDMLNTSRKVALPLIEYLDTQKCTVRDGDTRKAGPRLAELKG